MATYRHWYILVVRPRRCLCLRLSNPVPWQNWMAAYLGYTLRMRTLFCGWPVVIHDTHTRRRRRSPEVVAQQASLVICLYVVMSSAEHKSCWLQDLQNTVCLLPEVYRHMYEMTSEGVVDDDDTCVAVLECCWRDCGHEQSFHTFMDLQRHVYFHAYHTRLKSIGASLSCKNALPVCQFDSSNRNNLPELPDQLRCNWLGCEVCCVIFYY